MHGAAFFSEPLTLAADAQKRQKTPLIVVKSSLFIASRRVTRDFRTEYARKHLAEHNRVNSISPFYETKA